MIKIDDDLLKLNEKLVYSIINEYSKGDNKEDLYQVGMMAVIKAAKKYNENKNTKFSSYAYYYIKGEILKYLRESNSIRPSKDVISLYKKILLLKETIYKTSGKLITNEEISKTLSLPSEKIYEIENACLKVESLDSYINEEKNISLIDTIESKKVIDDFDLIALKDAISSLSQEEKAFIYERYYNNKTQTELAKEKNITQVKIYRYEKKILNKMKDKIV